MLHLFVTGRSLGYIKYAPYFREYKMRMYGLKNWGSPYNHAHSVQVHP